MSAASAFPNPDLGFTDRVLTAYHADWTPSVHHRLAGWLMPLAAAAALLAALSITLRPSLEHANDRDITAHLPRVSSRSLDREELRLAFANATSATLALARDASVPAARLGEQVLASSDLIESGPASSLSLPLEVGPAPSVEVWQSVGDGLNAGVRPLGGSARRAFGFLVGGLPDDLDSQPFPPRGG